MEEPDTDVKKDLILSMLDDVIQDLRDYEVRNANARLTHGAWSTVRQKLMKIEKEVWEY